MTYHPFKALIIIMMSSLLLACSSVQREQQEQPRRIQITRGTFIDLPLPSELNKELSISQLISVNWDKQSHQLPVQLEINSNQLTLAGFSLWGTRLLGLTYTEDAIRTESLATVGKDVTLPNPKQILFYLMLTLWPQEVWQQSLSPVGWTLEETDKQRKLINNQGKEIVSINYQFADKFTGKIELTNNIANYQVTILNQEKL